MIYELRNKIPQDSSFLTSEDVLTSTIFGNLRYFSDQNILINFLNEAIDIDGTKLSINNGNVFRIGFWERYYSKNNHKYNEPDLYLCNNEFDIIIECKYYSSLSGENITAEDNKLEYSNQLIRYSKIIERSKKIKIIIYLTNDINMPYEIILNSSKKLDKNINLYWLSWRMLYRVMNKFNDKYYNHGERQLFDDLFLFLRKRKLTIFCGLRIQNIEFYWEYCKQYNFIPYDFFVYNLWRYRNEK